MGFAAPSRRRREEKSAGISSTAGSFVQNSSDGRERKRNWKSRNLDSKMQKLLELDCAILLEKSKRGWRDRNLAGKCLISEEFWTEKFLTCRRKKSLNFSKFRMNLWEICWDYSWLWVKVHYNVEIEIKFGPPSRSHKELSGNQIRKLGKKFCSFCGLILKFWSLSIQSLRDLYFFFFFYIPKFRGITKSNQRKS